MRHSDTLRRATLVALACGCLAAGAALADGITVERAVVGAAVEEREPVGVATSFPADVGEVWFHTTLAGVAGPTTVEHVWSRDGEEKARVSLDVDGPRYRTWSSKSIPPEWAGPWTVAVVAADGTELASVEFTVGASE